MTVGITFCWPSGAGRKPPVSLAFAGLPAGRIRGLGTSHGSVPLVLCSTIAEQLGGFQAPAR
jgi:hypothetical protein